ncbi:hypothetical protein IU438_28795 [Nocardia cyriacigeorgica]|uniref:hypothetical protein n=1 Tax=Nocardia cyriacigeorgica TaxID=135487 RepID=UPI0018946C84|nr:hypothetical protein [Nocardia cyriacigeorgica]MBF6399771.1 hypothetical protein [Nocardia cyriacigeorgica]MBF6405400.1 hypothetical protein [Nocardia cyriacigeorgica]
MSLPDLTAEGHAIAARECIAIAEHFERVAEIHDGELAPYLARQHRADALAVRARAAKHLDLAIAKTVQDSITRLSVF